ncbi:prepilin peptidase [Aneurinibacillus aneurinilyticus]|uniref:Prepilin leader peptidase/N-methyltransferase n=1 Tax=Aneurinibacillus aneurinilyticus TaxID=1391 RepID=A0A848CV34_ANEAE|nr:A24 family peptidase [Aneurinibacillus aneurinilyticus]NME99008.1 prepilin peptidase [Aneurinibacillus aneurinilyticus]
MDFINMAIFFLFGIILGSFFNVVGLRIPEKQSIIAPPSHCPKCGKQLAPIDLIPVLSYLFIRGKCRQCKAGISPVYPIMEFITGFLFAAAYYIYGFTAEMWMTLLFASLLVIITVSDLAYRIIPDKVLLPFFITFLIARFFIHPHESYLSHLIGMVLGFSIFFGIALISRGGMGGGDIKLFTVVGLFLGYPLLFVTILFSTFLGTLYGILVMIIHGSGRKTEVPFGPFIAVAAMLAVYKGYDIISWYFNRFF